MPQDITNNIGGGGGYGGGGGNGNPFAMQQQSQQSMSQYPQSSPGGFPAKIGGVQVMFFSEADALRAQMALQGFELLPIFQTDDVVGRNGLLDRDGRLRYRQLQPVTGKRCGQGTARPHGHH